MTLTQSVRSSPIRLGHADRGNTAVADDTADTVDLLDIRNITALAFGTVRGKQNSENGPHDTIIT